MEKEKKNIDFNRIRFTGYVPTYDEYFDYYLKDDSMTNFVSFSKRDSSLIFYDDKFVGFYKTMIRDEEENDREIYIGLIPEYRKMGIASYVVNTLTKNIFESDSQCSAVHLSIDKDNYPSINLAHNCGFLENTTLEQELRDSGDNRTLIFSMKNRLYSNDTEITHTQRR